MWGQQLNGVQLTTRYTKHVSGAEVCIGFAFANEDHLTCGYIAGLHMGMTVWRFGLIPGAIGKVDDGGHEVAGMDQFSFEAGSDGLGGRLSRKEYGHNGKGEWNQSYSY